MRCAIIGAIVVLLPTFVWAHGDSTIQIHVGVVNNELTILNGTDVNGLRVFADNAEKFDGLGQSIVPGWQFDSELNSSVVRLNIMDELLYWNTANGLNAVTTDNLTLRRLFFPAGQPDSAALGPLSIADPVTTVWDSATVGQSHHIMRYEVPTGPGTGAYGVLLQVQDISAVPQFGSSDSFLLVLNKGLTNTPGSLPGQPLYPADSSEFGRAVYDIATAAVPEPSAIVLAAIGAAGIAMAWRRMRLSGAA